MYDHLLSLAGVHLSNRSPCTLFSVKATNLIGSESFWQPIGRPSIFNTHPAVGSGVSWHICGILMNAVVVCLKWVIVRSMSKVEFDNYDFCQTMLITINDSKKVELSLYLVLSTIFCLLQMLSMLSIIRQSFESDYPIRVSVSTAVFLLAFQFILSRSY